MKRGAVKTLKLLFEKQIYNYLGLAILFAIVAYATNSPGVYAGQALGGSTRFWFWLSIGVVIVHQFYVWFVWRTELHLGLMSRWFGKRAFSVWAAIFVILLVSRILSVFILGYANRSTWNISPALGWALTVLILVPAVYTLYSIERYFTAKRALGIDHFDPAYRQLGLVREGIFRYSSNAMYVFAAMMVWIPALVFGSKAALISAFFNYAYLWVHYYTLELPDMRRIYSSD
jgi:hypothetical protein